MTDTKTAEMQADLSSKRQQQLYDAALEYHEFPKPGKLAVIPTKSVGSPYDLALAYSPGVAAPCCEIQKDPSTAHKYTNRGNLVAVITNGTAVLGLGDIGPLAGKPVMEGKAVLFKKFANIDVFDLEINEKEDLDKLVDIIASLEPTFGGINLEDIKAPECFYVERKLRERMNIPVFHDDQHGTAIVVSAAVLSGLKVVGKSIEQVKLVASGAGAAAIACLRLLVSLGLPRENIWVTDRSGVVHVDRTEVMDEDKAYFAQKTSLRTLSDVMVGADIFLGLSSAGVVKPEMVRSMSARPLIFALANPTPEIMPEEIKAVRQDAVIATGRSDYPNQVNNVLCFPYIFRGALDSGASSITCEMEIATVRAIADLAQAEQSEIVAAAYLGEPLTFGPEYIIPKPFDPRLMLKIAPAVAQAAADSGVASRPITDMAAYVSHLETMVYASGTLMKPIFSRAKSVKNKRIAYAEGEEERVLRAAQIVADEGLARPVLIGRPLIIAQRIEKFGLRLQKGRDYEVVNIEFDDRYRGLWQTYHKLMARKGVTMQLAKIEMRRRLVLIGAMLLREGEVDGLICGTWGNPRVHLEHINNVLSEPVITHENRPVYACMSGLLLPDRQIFLVDTHLNDNPSAEQLAKITCMASEALKRFGIKPKVALLSHSNFGSSNDPSAIKMRNVLALLKQQAPEMEVDGEMHGDIALNSKEREAVMPYTTLHGDANLLVFPNLDAASISYNLLKTTSSSGVTVGPILLGTTKAVHILTASSTVRRIVNMSALAVVDANVEKI
jgi:malate dehydrogenase (oxaloacetate-decarboxylating)(NADP+)